MDELSKKQEDDFAKGRKTFDESSKEIFNYLKNSNGIKKAYESEGNYIIISDRNLIKTYLSSNEKKMSSINLTISNRYIEDKKEDKNLVLGYFKGLFEELDINYDEEKLLSLLKEDFNNSSDIKNTDYKYFNYGSGVWFRMVGIPNNGDKEGKPTGVEINISKNEPEED